MASALRKMGVYLGLVEDELEHVAEYDAYDAYDEEPQRPQSRPLHPVRDEKLHAPAVRPPAHRPHPVEAVESYTITTLHPRSYNDARTVGEYFRDGTPVIMNLTDMPDSDAKRLVDFAAGLVFGLQGTIERVTAKVFLLSPANVMVTAEEKARLAEGGFFNQS